MQQTAAATQGGPVVEVRPEPREERRACRASAVSIPLLALIAVSFFLPSFRSCSSPESVADLVGGFEQGVDWRSVVLGYVWLISPFLIATVLLSVTAAALLRRAHPGRRSSLVAAGGLLFCLLSVIYFPAFSVASFFTDPDPIPFTVFDAGFLVGSVLSVAAAILLLFRLSRRHGWHRWGHFIGAYTLLIAPHSLWFWDALDECNVLYGGCMYIGAFLGLLLTSCWAIVPILLRGSGRSRVLGEVHSLPSPPL